MESRSYSSDSDSGSFQAYTAQAETFSNYQQIKMSISLLIEALSRIKTQCEILTDEARIVEFLSKSFTTLGGIEALQKGLFSANTFIGIFKQHREDTEELGISPKMKSSFQEQVYRFESLFTELSAKMMLSSIDMHAKNINNPAVEKEQAEVKETLRSSSSFFSPSLVTQEQEDIEPSKNIGFASDKQ